MLIFTRLLSRFQPHRTAHVPGVGRKTTLNFMIMILSAAATDVESILMYVFIGIFVLTAALTLASLPNWIKLDEWYRKKLFLALILEVVGIIVLAAGRIFNPEETVKFEPPTDNSWIALNCHGQVVAPQIKVIDKSKNTVDSIRLGADCLSSTPELKLKMDFLESSEVSLLVKSADGVTLGRITDSALKNAGLYNLIQDVSTRNSYVNIRWVKDGKSWRRFFGVINKTSYDDFQDDEVVFKVYDTKAGTKYMIYNKTDTVYRSGTEEIDTPYRIIHFCKNSKNEYYLFRITSASFEAEVPFVNLIQIKLQPDISFSKER